jgi:hypothetical protein
VRGSNIAQALQELPDEFRLIYVDHRGLGRSDKPRDAEAYAMSLRVGDAVAVSDELGMERAHCIGNSWGGRLGVGAGDVDFHDQARCAASEIPRAEFISLEELEHVGAHLAQVDPVLPAVLRMLRGNGR